MDDGYKTSKKIISFLKITLKPLKIISIIIGIVYLFNSFGFTLLYFGLKSFHRQNMIRMIEENLPEKRIEHIIISKADVKLSKILYIRTGSKEFKLNGRMYDIVKEYETKESHHFCCIYDEHETDLDKAFEKKNNGETDSQTRGVYDEMQKNKSKESLQGKFKLKNLIELIEFNIIPSFECLVGFKIILIPPPKLLKSSLR